MTLPEDIKAETLLSLYRRSSIELTLSGNHKRNTYEDFLMFKEDDAVVKAELARPGIYDILPEALFHPIDRFDNLPTDNYKERFNEEYEAEQLEEARARDFFAPFDRFLFDVGCEVNAVKTSSFSDNSILADIILDSSPVEYQSNRFIGELRPFIPLSNKIRGNISLITMILRKVLRDEGLQLEYRPTDLTFSDSAPHYDMSLEELVNEETGLYLGAEYDENVTEYEILYWNEDECTAMFLDFVAEMQIFENFVNDYFVGIESRIRFNIYTQAPPTVVSDDSYFNYLDYNTNL